jgi:hypothetical protein
MLELELPILFFQHRELASRTPRVCKRDHRDEQRGKGNELRGHDHPLNQQSEICNPKSAI